MNYLRKVQISGCGISLAIASLGNLIGVHSIYLKAACGIIAAAMIILATLKILIYRQDFGNDMNNINIVSIFPTYFMTIMVLTTYGSINFGGVNILKFIWLLAFSAHIMLALLFIKNHILRFDINNVLPNWFITCVAYALVGIAAPEYGLRGLGRIVVTSAIICYFILFPIVFYRVLIVRHISENLKPTIWLFNSPINICIVAYMSSFETINPIFLLVLLTFSIFSFAFSLFNVGLRQIFRNGFDNSLAAFTFPTVIFFTAIRNAYYFFHDNGWLKVDLSLFITLFEAACIVVVFGIFAAYIVYGIKPQKNNTTEPAVVKNP